MELIALQFDLDGPLGVVLAVSRVVFDDAADPVDVAKRLRDPLAALVAASKELDHHLQNVGAGALVTIAAAERVIDAGLARADATMAAIVREMLAATVRQGTVGTMSRRRRHDCRPGRTTP